MYVDDDVDEGRKEENQAQDTNGNNTRKEEPQPLTGEAKIHHYQSVLRPSHSPPSKEHLSIYNSLPDPKPFSTFLSQTRHYLQIHPYALIGEIGLDRQFRIPEAWAPASEEQERDKDLTPGGREGRRLTPFRVDMCHQKRILKAQLRLAAEMNRAVSIHGVQAHGAVFEILRESWKGHEKPTLSKRERKRRGTDHPSVMQNNDSVNGNGTERETRKPYPPRICLHSYSGNPDAFGQFLDPKIPVQIFASFSTAINLSDNLASNAASEDDAAKYEEFAKMIKTVPEHMLLVESDLHTAGQAMDERMEDIVRRICEIKGWALEEGVRILKRNWIRFVFGDDGEEAKLEGCPDDRKTETL
jgi:Tat protein secretion system quality control protein TatD with DNase activity